MENLIEFYKSKKLKLEKQLELEDIYLFHPETRVLIAREKLKMCNKFIKKLKKIQNPKLSEFNCSIDNCTNSSSCFIDETKKHLCEEHFIEELKSRMT